MSALVKEAGHLGIPLLQIIFVRAVISVVLSLADILPGGCSSAGPSPCAFVWSGVVGFSGPDRRVLCAAPPVDGAGHHSPVPAPGLYRAFGLCISSRAPDCRHTGLHHAQPARVGMYGDALLGERSGQAPASLWPVMAGLGGALGSGIAYTLVRKLVATEHPSVIVLYFPLVCVPGTLLLGGADFVWPTATGWWVLLGVGCFTQIGQLALTKAMQRDAASRVTSLSYVQIIFAAVLGWWIFGEMPTQATFLGGGLILLGAVVSAWMQPRPAQP